MGLEQPEPNQAWICPPGPGWRPPVRPIRPPPGAWRPGWPGSPPRRSSGSARHTSSGRERPDRPGTGVRPDRPGVRPDRPTLPGNRPERPGARPDRPGALLDRPAISASRCPSGTSSRSSVPAGSAAIPAGSATTTTTCIPPKRPALATAGTTEPTATAPAGTAASQPSERAASSGQSIETAGGGTVSGATPAPARRTQPAVNRATRHPLAASVGASRCRNKRRCHGAV